MPIIGISTGIGLFSSNFSSAQKLAAVHEAYLSLVNSYGCSSVLLPPSLSIHTKELVRKIDGLILTSGQDVHPNSYNEDLIVSYCQRDEQKLGRYNRPSFIAPSVERDTFEIELCNYALEYNIPILGICRGLQIINVALGGTLLQELDQDQLKLHYIQDDGWINYHKIKILKDTLVHELLTKDECMTSSIHHQAINKLGNNLKVAAVSEDNVIEIIEGTGFKNLVLGLQGHAEKTRDCLPELGILLNKFFDQVKLGAK